MPINITREFVQQFRELNQTIQELKEQLNKNSKTVPSHPQAMALKSLHPKVCVSHPERKQADSTVMRDTSGSDHGTR